MNVSKLILIDPVITIKKTETRKAESSPASGMPSAVASSGKGKNNFLEVRFDRLIVTNGQIDYLNSAPENALPSSNPVSQVIEENIKNFSFRLQRVRLEIKDIVLPPKPVQMSFDFSGTLAADSTPLASSQVKGHGWVNWLKKDMQGDFSFADKNGKTGMTANVISENNNMTVEGKVNARNLQVWHQKDPSSNASDIQNVVFGTLSSMGFEIDANFSFKTQMDNFKVEAISFSGTVNQTAGKSPEPLPNHHSP